MNQTETPPQIDVVVKRGAPDAGRHGFDIIEWDPDTARPLRLDGSYQPFQQGAQVSADMATPAPILMVPAQLVNITFTTHAPADSARGIPIRMVGNTLSLGNSFADLGGGVSSYPREDECSRFWVQRALGQGQDPNIADYGNVGAPIRMGVEMNREADRLAAEFA